VLAMAYPLRQLSHDHIIAYLSTSTFDGFGASQLRYIRLVVIEVTAKFLGGFRYGAIVVVVVVVEVVVVEVDVLVVVGIFVGIELVSIV
jgi:hypothetical protein